VVVDPASGSLTFTLPLPHVIRSREADINLSLTFRSHLNSDGGKIGSFWQPSWQKILVADFTDYIDPAECEADPTTLPISKDQRVWLNAVPRIVEHNGELGTRVWVNRDAMEGTSAFLNFTAMGLPSGNLSGQKQILPPDYTWNTTYAAVDMPGCGDVRATLGMGPSVDVMLRLGNLDVAEARTGVADYVPPLGIFDKFKMDCETGEIHIRRPNGVIDVFSPFRVNREHQLCSNMPPPGGGGPPGFPLPEPNLRSQAISTLLRTEFPNGDFIEYVYDPETGLQTGIRDTFGRMVVEFSYEDPERPNRIHRIKTHQAELPGAPLTETIFTYVDFGGTTLLSSVSQATDADKTWSFDYETVTFVSPTMELRSESASQLVLEEVRIYAPMCPFDPVDPDAPGNLPLIKALFEIPTLPGPPYCYDVFTPITDLWLGNKYSGQTSFTVDVGPDSYPMDTGKHVTYEYQFPNGVTGDYLCIVTDSAGLTRTHTFDWQSREIQRDESGTGITGTLTTTFDYHDLYPNVIKTTYPKENWTEEFYQFQQDDLDQLSYFTFPDLLPDPGEPTEVVRDRFQGGNLLRRTQASDTIPQGQEIVEAWTYEPLLNQVRSETDARDFTTYHTYDYQELSGPTAFMNDWWIDTSTPYLFGAGDSNGDGRSDQAVGRRIRTTHPSVTVGLSGSPGSPQVAVETLAYGDFGELLWEQDPEGNYTTYTYWPAPSPGIGPAYLKKTIIDDIPPTGAVPGETYAQLDTRYGYDVIGRKIWEKNPRGFHHVWAYDEFNRVTREKKGGIDSGGAPLTAAHPADPDGVPAYEDTVFDYDLNDNLVEVREWNNDPATKDRPSLTGPNQVVSYYGYDILDQLRVVSMELIDPLQDPSASSTLHRTFYHYDDNGKVIKEVSPEGRATTYAYDALARVLSKRKHTTIDPTPGTEVAPPLLNTDPLLAFGHDDNSNMDRVDLYRSATGFVTFTMDYDEFDRRKALHGPEGISTHQELDKAGNITRVYKEGPRDGSDTEGGILSDISYLHDERSRIYETMAQYFGWDFDGTTWTQVPLGGDGLAVEQVGYDRRSLVTTRIDDLGRQSDIDYDGAGREITAWLPQVAGFPQGDRNRTSKTYDGNGNVIVETAYEVGRDGTGVVVTEEFPTENDFDELDRLVESRILPRVGETEPALTSRIEYSSRGDRTGSWNPKGVGTRSLFDTLHREAETRVGYQYPDFDETTGIIEAPDGVNTDHFITAQKFYDDDGNIRAWIDDEGRDTIQLFDAVGRLEYYGYADLSAETIEYGRDGTIQKESRLDSAQVELFHIVYQYDEALRKTRADFNLQPGSGLAGVDAETFEYDGQGRVTHATAVGTLLSGVVTTSTVTKTYDSAGNVRTDYQELTADDGSSPITNSDETACTYDTLGNRTRVETLGGSYVVDYLFDELDRIAGISRENLLLHDFEYLGTGHRLEVRLDGNLTRCEVGQSGYDPFRRLEIVSYLDPASNLQTGFTYSYDAVGNQLEEQKDHDLSASHAFEYDKANRLKLYRAGDPLQTQDPQQEYGLDGVGNWREHEIWTGPSASTTYAHTVNAVHEYQSEFDENTVVYDKRGNLTEYGDDEYVYDAKGRIVEATVGTNVYSYAYDAEGRRVLAEGWFVVHEKAREIRQEKFTTGNNPRDFVYGTGIDEVLSYRKGSATYYVQHNRISSAVALTNSSGAVVERHDYTPYGVVLGSGSTVGYPYLFAGRRKDSGTGLYYMRARYYHPEMGRFTARDQIGVWGDANNWGNPFTYGASNPLSFADPMGATSDRLSEFRSYGSGLSQSSSVAFASGTGASHPYSGDTRRCHPIPIPGDPSIGGMQDFATGETVRSAIESAGPAIQRGTQAATVFAASLVPILGAGMSAAEGDLTMFALEAVTDATAWPVDDVVVAWKKALRVLDDAPPPRTGRLLESSTSGTPRPGGGDGFVTESAHTEKATTRGARQHGSSIQEQQINPSTGERRVQHTVVGDNGRVLDGPHPRPDYKPRRDELATPEDIREHARDRQPNPTREPDE